MEASRDNVFLVSPVSNGQSIKIVPASELERRRSRTMAVLQTRELLRSFATGEMTSDEARERAAELVGMWPSVEMLAKGLRQSKGFCEQTADRVINDVHPSRSFA